MNRFTFVGIVVVAGLCSSNAFAQKKKAETAKIDLKGKTLAQTFDALLPGMGTGDQAAQNQWQEICFVAGAPNNESQRAEVCGLMLAKLGDNTPKPARIWLLKQLERIGREEAVDGVAALLNEKDELVRDAAVRCLTNNPSPKATAQLIAALPASTGKHKIGLLNGLGYRHDPAAVEALTKELNPAAPEIAEAAARALGRIPGPAALKALAAARASSKDRVRQAIAAAEIVQADRLIKEGKLNDARAIFVELRKADEALPIRLAGLRGEILTSGDMGGSIVLEVLGGTDNAARAVAIAQIEQLPAGALKVLGGSLDKLPASSRVAVITALADRGDRSLLPIALSAAKSDDPAVKRAGIQAIGRLGDASTVEFLLSLLTGTGTDPLAGVASESLAQLPAEGVNEKLLAVLEGEKATPRMVSLIDILERRKAASAVPTLLKSAIHADKQVRAASFAGLKALAGPEHLRPLLNVLLKTEKGKEREQVELAIVAVCEQIPEPEKRTAPIFAAITDGTNKTDLLPLLGRLGGAEALQLLRTSLSTGDSALNEAALAGLCNWPDAAASDVIIAQIVDAKTPESRAKLMRALIRINTLPIERTSEERLAVLNVLQKAMELASQDAERQAILEGLGTASRHLETLRYILPYLDKATLDQAACKGIVELAHSKMLRQPNMAEFDKALDRVIAICKDKGLVDRAKQYKADR